MKVVLNEMKIKYEDRKLYVWREMWGKRKLKNPDWWELKGTLDKDGYRCVQINYKQYKYHRVVYYLHNDGWKIHDTCRNNSIDHIDRDRLNNNIENLRVVTQQQNLWNRNAKGYCFHKPSGKYVAQIMVDGKQKSLGYFETEDDARNAYLNAKAKYHHIPPVTPL